MSLWGMGGAIAFSFECALAQITPDSTLGAESSVVTSTNNNGVPTNQIDGGARRGANLFHSFEQFSVPTGGTAYFSNALDIQNIISRVTGTSISSIDGLIRANGTANLFLLNPNGIIFGPNASLNIGGSFAGSTASSLNFADGTQFSATAPQTTPLLTVSVPLGLQFEGTAGGIQVQQSLLQVQNGQTLALIGGDVSVEGGEFRFLLSAPGGRIELGGLASAGVVNIEGQQSEGAFGLTRLRFPDSVERTDVLLTDLAYVNGAALRGRSIAINARNIDITSSSLIGGIESDSGFPEAQAGDISLNGTGSVNVADSFIVNRVRTGAVGKGGNIDITAKTLSLTNGAQLDTNTSGSGDAGSVNINVRDTVSFKGVDSGGSPSGAFSRVEPRAEGNAGDINILTGSLSLSDGAQVSTSTYGIGDAGDLTVRASDSVELVGTDAERPLTGLFANVTAKAEGSGGNLTIETARLSVSNRAEVSASTFGRGEAGDLTVRVSDSVEVSNGRLFSQVEPKAEGSGGNLTIKSGQLTVSGDDALVVARTLGKGNAGNLTVDTGRLNVSDGAQLSTSTHAIGDVGDLTVRATEVELIGTTADGQFASGLFAQVDKEETSCKS